MVSRCLIALAGLSLILAVAAPTQAGVLTESLDSDTELNNRLPGSQKVVIAEGRIGDRAGAATFEADLGASTAAPGTQAQFDWPNAEAVPFAFTRDGAGDYTFTLEPGAASPTTLTVSGFAAISDLFIRTRATQGGSSITLSNLTLDGQSIPDVSADGDSDGLGLLHVGGAGVFDGAWSLAGDATMTWTDAAPSNSHLAFQLKGGNAIVPIPEPATAALLLVGGALILAPRRAR